MSKPHLNYHLVGVGGVGMSALAQLLLASGCRVSGSDRYHDQGRELDVLNKLRSLGVNLQVQDGRAVTEDLDAVIISSAIENDNPDLIAAGLKGIPVVHRAEMLADLARDKECIAVTGTAGKSTVAGMIGWTLAGLGLDPTVVNGGAVLNWVNGQNPGNFRFGRSKWWVLELDESDRSLLLFSPEWAVITNVSKDHFDLQEVRKLFADFAKQVGKTVVGPGFTRAPPGRAEAGSDPENGAAAWPSEFNASMTEEGISFTYRGIRFNLTLLGKHNAENALYCVMLCEKIGLDLRAVSKILAKFSGIERRLETVGRVNGITVIDDYAHNPAKIAAAWRAVEPFSRRIIAVWRPHGYGPLALMRREFTDVFSEHVRSNDHIIIMSVYFAGGTAKREVTSRMLADDLASRGLPARYVENYEDLLPILLKLTVAGDTVLLMGARDPDLTVFARRFVFELNHLVVNRMAGAGGVAKENESADKTQHNSD